MPVVATVHDLRERLKRPLKLELASGCRDSVVVGGVEKLLDSVGAPFADVRAVMTGYRSLSLDERPDRIVRALKLLDELAAAAPSEQPSDAHTSTGTDGGAAAANDSTAAVAPPADLLDQPLSKQRVHLGLHAARKLGEVGIRTYRDLLHHYPRRYEDRRSLPSFATLAGRESATVAGTLLGRKASKSRSGMVIVRAFLEDRSGFRLDAVWFNQPWLEAQLFPGQRVVVSGRVKWRGRRPELHVQHFEVEDDGESLSTERIVGIYPSTQGLSQAYLRRAVHRLISCLGTVRDHLPRRVLARYGLAPLDRALRAVHFPTDEQALEQALRRLKFDEFLFLELRVLLNRDTHLTGKRFAVSRSDLERFEQTLPFALTGAQRRALEEILSDMSQPRQMARLLQGDVGSGKTAVAAAAIYLACRNGYQAALMAPTEILARQHFLNLRGYLYPLGVRCELLLGTMSSGERGSARSRVALGEADLAVGTHALIQEGVEFKDLGLAVIDEEHRFGVEQRRQLLTGLPDVLVMSATPIPRSLALTYYGDLELSVIDELPPGRQPVATRLISAAKRHEAYSFAWRRIREGRQVYLVAPLIEESDSESMSEIVSATKMFEDLRAIMPQECRIDLLHGKMNGRDKDRVMERFRRHESDMLVSTTVVEVGVDVGNATVMIIENAERFGLSQLHQLRGRVGRGAHESHCILINGDSSSKTRKRLEVVAKHADGFVIAEKDLALRGPGELRGTRQSGLPDLVLGDLATDGDLIEASRELAKRILEHDPRLKASWAGRLKEELKRRSRAVSLREII